MLQKKATSEADEKDCKSKTVQGNAQSSVGSESLTPAMGREDALKCGTYNREHWREVVPSNLKDNV